MKISTKLLIGSFILSLMEMIIGITGVYNNQNKFEILVVVSIGVLITIGMVLYMNHMISKPIKNMINIIDKLSKGDLDVQIYSNKADEIGNLEQSLYRMIENLKIQASNADKIVQGDLNFTITPRCEKDILTYNMKQILETTNSLIVEMENMYKHHNVGDISVYIAEEKFQGSYKIMAKVINDIIKNHIHINKKTITCVSELAKGNFESELGKFPGEMAFINESIEELRNNLKNINGEINKLVIASKEGRLEERANSQAFCGDWATLINSLNDILGAVIEPLNEANQVLYKMSVNDLTMKINGKYNGMLEEFAGSINNVHTRLSSIQNIFVNMSRGDISFLEEYKKVGKRSENDKMLPAMVVAMTAIKDLINEARTLANSAVNGDLSARGNSDKFEGDYKEIIEGMNDTIDAFTKPINDSMKVLQKFSVNDYSINMSDNYKGDFNTYANSINDLHKRLLAIQRAFNDIADGDISFLEEFKKIGKRCENDKLIPALIRMMETIENLFIEIEMLTQSSIAGNLEARGNSTKFKGNNKIIVEQVNKLIDALNAPMNEANQVLYKMSVNDLTTQMTGKYNGMLEEFASSINNVHTRLSSIQNIFVNMSRGDISFLEEYKKVGKRSENDKMLPAMVVAMTAIKDLINEARTLVNSAVKGDLSARGNSDKFEGDYKEIIEGMNDTIDAFTKPINDSMKVLQKFSVNDYSINMSDNYKGDFNTYANSINDLHKRLLAIQRAFNDIADGDISFLEEFKRIGKRCENDELIPALIRMMETIENLFIEIEMLTESSIAGKLEVRGNSTKFKGNNKIIVEQVNKLIDALNAPMNEANQVLYKMSVNDLTTQMTGKYNGMLKNFADSINNVHTRLISIQQVFIDMAKGDISIIEKYKNIGKRSENDKMLPAMLVAMTAIKDLVNEASMLANFAVNGDLSARGNVDKFEGGYKEIIQGMNNTMDAVIKPIQEAAVVLQEMAKGDLTVNMNGDYKGEYTKIKNSLNLTVNSFNDILKDINNAAQQVAAGSRQVSDGSQALSQGSTEQAGSIEELSSAITQIASQTKQNAISASQANELGINAKENAIQGNEEMQEMLKAMIEINEASNNISKIIKVIDEIAFQTNILALNAAVEAARAGQHGKGFAVVAEEVRNLAERSANAAKETTAMIEGSIHKVEIGTKIANETAVALNKIVSGVEKAANLVGNIATASNEQATGIAQINKGIEQVSAVVQTNSATAEESAAASEELTSQAQVLSEMVSKFKLNRVSGFAERYEMNNHSANPNIKIKSEVSRNIMSGWGEAAAISSKPVIELNDSEFGKY